MVQVIDPNTLPILYVDGPVTVATRKSHVIVTLTQFNPPAEADIQEQSSVRSVKWRAVAVARFEVHIDQWRQWNKIIEQAATIAIPSGDPAG